ncbi:MAG: dipeptide epimerase [Candidatus Poribacteria bacterium]|nr:dipeptide epimerase [Candidatus Poribacteria bacterium]
MNIEQTVVNLQLRHPFQTGRSAAEPTRRNLHVRIGAGMGEAAPTPYYGETLESVQNAVNRYAAVLKNVDEDAPIERVAALMKTTLGGNASARAAIESALWDRLGRRLNVPLHKVWGIDGTTIAPTSYTIGLDSLDVMQEKVRQAEPYKILKVKLGTPYDIEIIRAIRELTDKPIRVDANTAWSPKKAVRLCEQLAELGVELVEQPVAADDWDGLKFVRENSPIPIIADESCRTAQDIRRLAGCVDGINIKLAKCGGVSEALTMIRLARVFQMRVMVGCMIETSIGIGMMAQLAALADYVDLDGHLLIVNDPYQGPALTDGAFTLPDAPGIGTRYRTGT